jgi:hypothetical protein
MSHKSSLSRGHQSCESERKEERKKETGSVPADHNSSLVEKTVKLQAPAWAMVIASASGFLSMASVITESKEGAVGDDSPNPYSQIRLN